MWRGSKFYDANIYYIKNKKTNTMTTLILRRIARIGIFAILMLLATQAYAQKKAMKRYGWDMETWRSLFGRNYL